jgi:thiosulfate/3-mercaptopyruvate sulfurtransferase
VPAATWKTIVPAQALAAQLDNPDWVIVDTRFDLKDPDAGRRAYEAAHIPGAHYAHLDDDLAGPVRADSGRHPLPDPAALTARFDAWGVGDGVQLVAYDDNTGAIAARLWWLVRWLGHDAVAVLDGGLTAWRAAGLPLTAGPAVARRSRSFAPRVRKGMDIGVDALVSGLAADELLLVDARAAARFRGETEPIDARAGHVPGAINEPFQENLGPDGRFLDRDLLEARYTALLAGRDPVSTVCMCGSGVTACHNLLALEHAGIHGARLYVGSWSEWIRDSRRPIATGAR